VNAVAAKSHKKSQKISSWLFVPFCGYSFFAMTDQPITAKLVVLSGPSGVGKSTIVRRVLDRFPKSLRLSISATTRPARPGERDGFDYHFLTPEEFTHRRQAGEFLECFEVFGRGHWYGTLLSEVTPSGPDKKWVILDIDVDGAAKVRQLFPTILSIFLHPGSEEELERRLRARGTETEEAIQRRLEVARRELARAGEYQYIVTNDSLDEAVEKICDLLEQEGIAT
jgi:guanylate kinase